MQISANIALVKNLTLHGVFWGSYMKQQPATLQKSIAVPLQWLAQALMPAPLAATNVVLGNIRAQVLLCNP